MQTMALKQENEQWMGLLRMGLQRLRRVDEYLQKADDGETRYGRGAGYGREGTTEHKLRQIESMLFISYLLHLIK